MFSMLRRILLLLLPLVLGCAATQSHIKSPSRIAKIRRVAVLPFSSNHRAMGETIAEALAGQLVSSRFAVMERSQLQALLAEQNLTIDGIVRGDESFVGKIRGVDALVLGSATIGNGFAGLINGGNIDYVSACTARLVDTSSGEVLFATTFKSSGPTGAHGTASPGNVAEWLAEDFQRL